MLIQDKCDKIKKFKQRRASSTKNTILSPLFSSVAPTLAWEHIPFNSFFLLNVKPSRPLYGVFY